MTALTFSVSEEPTPASVVCPPLVATVDPFACVFATVGGTGPESHLMSYAIHETDAAGVLGLNLTDPILATAEC